MTIIGFDWVSKKHLISIATMPISLLTRTQVLMNVPYGNPHGPTVDCCSLHFCTVVLVILLLSDDGNGFPETL